MLVRLLAVFSVYFLVETLPTSFCSPIKASEGSFGFVGIRRHWLSYVPMVDGTWSFTSLFDKVRNFLVQIFARHFNSTAAHWAKKCERPKSYTYMFLRFRYFRWQMKESGRDGWWWWWCWWRQGAFHAPCAVKRDTTLSHASKYVENETSFGKVGAKRKGSNIGGEDKVTRMTQKQAAIKYRQDTSTNCWPKQR